MDGERVGRVIYGSEASYDLKDSAYSDSYGYAAGGFRRYPGQFGRWRGGRLGAIG
ncbi:MAG: hypothetical protein LBD58_00990 [Treponema sp.]|nr:hypothetical protein [Treponema sp.]